MSLADTYKLTQDEQSRQAFVGALKAEVNGPLQQGLEQVYENKIRKQAPEADNIGPTDRQAATALFQRERAYQLWGALTYHSQDFLWESIGETTDRILADFSARADSLVNADNKLGTLQLDSELELPKPIADVEIHRQPGGYFFQQDDSDLTAALLYMGSVELYTAAKGFMKPGAKPGGPFMGLTVANMVQKRFPNIQPERVLDLGCGVGTGTLGLKQAWPEAEVHGLDLSAPFVRFAHAWAEDHQTPMHFRQADAAATGYADNSFDLVVSTILFHETWHDKVGPIMQEARRLLRPGGVFLNVDVPWQPERLSVAQRVTNHWQVRNNGEPFWTGFGDTDVRQALRDAGFQDERTFADYEGAGGPMQYYVFGGSAGA